MSLPMKKSTYNLDNYLKLLKNIFKDHKFFQLPSPTNIVSSVDWKISKFKSSLILNPLNLPKSYAYLTR